MMQVRAGRLLITTWCAGRLATSETSTGSLSRLCVNIALHVHVGLAGPLHAQLPCLLLVSSIRVATWPWVTGQTGIRRRVVIYSQHDPAPVRLLLPCLNETSANFHTDSGRGTGIP
jgi:hypothetical protein